MLARRVFGKYLTPKVKHVNERIEEIEQRTFEEELEGLMREDLNNLKELYEKREIELE